MGKVICVIKGMQKAYYNLMQYQSLESYTGKEDSHNIRDCSTSAAWLSLAYILRELKCNKHRLQSQLSPLSTNMYYEL